MRTLKEQEAARDRGLADEPLHNFEVEHDTHPHEWDQYEGIMATEPIEWCRCGAVRATDWTVREIKVLNKGQRDIRGLSYLLVPAEYGDRASG